MSQMTEPTAARTVDTAAPAEPVNRQPQDAGKPDQAVNREKPASPQQASPQKKTAWRAAGAILLIAAGIAGYRFWQYSQTYEETDDAQIDGHMNIVSTRVPGTVEKVHVTENQPVQAGQILIELDPGDYQVALARAQASLAQAQAQVRTEAPSIPITTTTTETKIAAGRANVASAEAALAVARRELEAREAVVGEAEAQYARAAADLSRYEALVKKDQVSRLEYDEKVAAAKSAAASVESAKAAASAARQTIQQREAIVALNRSELDQAVRNAPQEVSAQRASLDYRQASTAVAKAALDEAKLNLSYTKITAPVSGILGRKNVEPGQRVQPGQQLLAIVPLDDIWVTANYKETQLKSMKAGQRATIHVDAYGKDYEGYVESMPPSTAARFSILPPENATGNYVRVVQRLPVRLRFQPGQDPGQRLRPGMSVLPKVWIK
jgi:membrane fusion protein (multidrug efflux system)